MQQIGQVIAGEIIGDATKRIASAVAGKIGSVVKSITGSHSSRRNPGNRRKLRRPKNKIPPQIKNQCKDLQLGRVEKITQRGHTKLRSLVLDGSSFIQIGINPEGPLFTWLYKGASFARGTGVYTLSIDDLISGTGNESYRQMYDEFETMSTLFDEFLVSAVTLTFKPTNAIRKGFCYPNSDIYIRSDFNMSNEVTESDLRCVQPQILSLGKSTTKCFTFGRVGEQLNHAYNVSASSRVFHQWYFDPQDFNGFKTVLNRYLSRCVTAIEMPLWGQESATQPGAYSVFDIKVKVLLTLRGERDVIPTNTNKVNQGQLEIPNELAKLHQASLAARPLEADLLTQPANTVEFNLRKNHAGRRKEKRLNDQWSEIFTDPNCLTDSDEE